MRLRVTRQRHSSSASQKFYINEAASPPPPSDEGLAVHINGWEADGRPRFSIAAGEDLDHILRTRKRLGLLIERPQPDGSNRREVWWTSALIDWSGPSASNKAWTLRTESSIYSVEVLSPARNTGSAPVVTQAEVRRATRRLSEAPTLARAAAAPPEEEFPDETGD